MIKKFFSPQKNKDAEEKKRYVFWGNLPLSRKLLLAFGVLFIFAVIIAVVTLNGSNRTQAAYKDALAKGIEIRRLSDQLRSNLLQARSNEKSFLLHWRREGYYTAQKNYVTLYTQNVADMHKDLDQLAVFGPVVETLSTGGTTQAQYEADIASLTQNVDTYEKSFNALLNAYLKKGFDDITDYENQFRTAATSMDSGLFYGQAGIEQLKVSFLRIRISEKNYLANSEQSYATEINTYMPLLEEQIKATDKLKPGEKTALLKEADTYLTAFNALVELDKEIATYNQDLIKSSSAVEALTVKIKRLGEQLATDDINRANASNVQTFTTSIITVFVVLILSVLLSLTLSRQLTRPIISLTRVAREISTGKFEVQAQVDSADEIGALAQTFNNMTFQLQVALQNLDRRAKEAETARAEAEAASAEAKSASKSLEAQMWLATGQTKLTDAMRGEQEFQQLAENVISQLCQYMGAQAGALFLLNEKTLTLMGRYAFTKRPGFDDNFQLGEGLVGQAAMDGKLFHLKDIPPETLIISTGLMGVKPREVIAAPFYANGEVVGILELVTLSVFTQSHFELLKRISEGIGVVFRTAQTRQRLAELLVESQHQAEELQSQEEELRAANEELQAQAENLKVKQAGQLKAVKGILNG